MVDNLCKKSVLVSDILACNFATFLRATSRLLLPLTFWESLRCNERSFLRRFFNGLGALTFSPLLNVAKSMMPKSIPIDCPLLGKISELTSTTKLRKYLSALSLMTVTDDGSHGSGRLQTMSNLPTLVRVTVCSCILNPPTLNLADCFDLRFLKLGGRILTLSRQACAVTGDSCFIEKCF